MGFNEYVAVLMTFEELRNAFRNAFLCLCLLH